MNPNDPVENSDLLASASTADVYAWGKGQVLKLFKERTPWHANEITATRAAKKAHLPVPEVVGDLVEVGEREGIVFERVEGPTMTVYIEDHPDEVEECALQAAELHTLIHSIEVPEIFSLLEVLTWSIQQVDLFGEETRKAVLDVMNELPAEEMLCHNDFYPGNIIVSRQGPVIIDWAIGTRGNPLADLARTWMISKMWLEGVEGRKAPDHLCIAWQQFWETYFRRYVELRSFNSEDFRKWQIVAVTASVVWGPPITPGDRRESFVTAALDGTEHPWLNS